MKSFILSLAFFVTLNSFGYQVVLNCVSRDSIDVKATFTIDTERKLMVVSNSSFAFQPAIVPVSISPAKRVITAESVPGAYMDGSISLYLGSGLDKYKNLVGGTFAATIDDGDGWSEEKGRYNCSINFL